MNIQSRERVLSVATPCIDKESTIEELLNRVLLQRVVGEVIAINDALTENSLGAIGRITDNRLQTLTLTENKGKGNAISVGIAMAKNNT